jgi:hypothetical protein
MSHIIYVVKDVRNARTEWSLRIKSLTLALFTKDKQIKILMGQCH